LLKIAGISTVAKEAARSAGLDNNQTALLRVAAAEPKRQAAVVQEIVAFGSTRGSLSRKRLKHR
jgi:hypothetical protein